MAEGLSPSEALRRMLQGYQASQALHVAAVLGVADHLAAGALGAEELAGRTGADAPTLYRLLRLLASLGVFAEDDAGRFALTPLAECLRSDAPGSQRAWAVMVCGPSFWSSWGELLHSVRTGETAFPRVHGVDRWTYLAQHPEASAVFDAAMTANTALEAAAVASAYDYSRFRVLADVGGGAGGLLATILAANPSLRGILVDLPYVVAGAAGVLAAAGVADRCQVVGGDFFAPLPSGADAYVLKSVLHNWPDDRALALLRNLRAAMADGATLLLVERVVRPGNAPDPAKFMDLLMLVMNGGRERTTDDFAQVLAAAGFRLTEVVPTAGPLSVVEGRPV